MRRYLPLFFDIDFASDFFFGCVVGASICRQLRLHDGRYNTLPFLSVLSTLRMDIQDCPLPTILCVLLLGAETLPM